MEAAGERDDPDGEVVQLISRAELNERTREWRIREDVVEKDYVIGWTLWGIGSDSCLSASWAFKGGTCLKKCYMETGRLSEDLDFTVLPGGLSEARQLVPTLMTALGRVSQESGIDFQGREPVVRPRPDGRSLEVRINYLRFRPYRPCGKYYLASTNGWKMSDGWKKFVQSQSPSR